MNIGEDAKKAKDELLGYLDGVKSPAARVGIICGVGFVALLLILATMPWSLLIAVGAVAAWYVLKVKK